MTISLSRQEAIYDIAEPFAYRMATDLHDQFVYDYHSFHDCFRLGGSVEFDGYDFRVDSVEDGEARLHSSVYLNEDETVEVFATFIVYPNSTVWVESMEIATYPKKEV